MAPAIGVPTSVLEEGEFSLLPWFRYTRLEGLDYLRDRQTTREHSHGCALHPVTCNLGYACAL